MEEYAKGYWLKMRTRIIMRSVYFSLLILVLSAKDIAMLAINFQNECSLLTDDGGSNYVHFGLSTWMLVASVGHMSWLALLLCFK